MYVVILGGIPAETVGRIPAGTPGILAETPGGFPSGILEGAAGRRQQEKWLYQYIREHQRAYSHVQGSAIQ